MKNLLSLSLVSLALISSMAFARDEESLKPLKEITIADGRTIVASASGITVYTFDPDLQGISTCYDGCAKTWPPVTVASADGLVAPMGVTQRKTGELQLTLLNKPVYFFKGDKLPGDINGDGLGNVWHIIVD